MSGPKQFDKDLVKVMSEPMKSTRRDLLSGALPLAAGAGFKAQAGSSSASSEPKKLNVVCVGGHPDDPESGCGGTLGRYSQRGHNVTLLYLTRGENGIKGKTRAETAEIRTKEALSACKILGGKPLFAGQINGDCQINNARYDEFHQLLSAQDPDLVFTHWPIDTHIDHRAASNFAYESWVRQKKSFALVYYEVMSGGQTQNFHPDLFVDITETWEKKKAACFAHESQDPSDFYAWHEQMERFRGLEAQVGRAEAFVVHSQGPRPPLAW